MTRDLTRKDRGPDIVTTNRVRVTTNTDEFYIRDQSSSSLEHITNHLTQVHNFSNPTCHIQTSPPVSKVWELVLIA